MDGAGGAGGMDDPPPAPVPTPKPVEYSREYFLVTELVPTMSDTVKPNCEELGVHSAFNLRFVQSADETPIQTIEIGRR